MSVSSFPQTSLQTTRLADWPSIPQNVMIEPDTLATIWIKHLVYPAFLLTNDEGQPLKPSSVILRHRHLHHQQHIIQR